jgi:hypothetical protein
MAGLLLVQVPPVVGDRVVMPPTQMLLVPVILTTGRAFTVTGAVGAETQPVDVLVKVKVAVPADTPVTTPPFVTVATPGLLLTQVPPDVGDKVVVKPAQMVVLPVMLTGCVPFTVTAAVGADTQPVVVFVKVNVAVPADTAVTTPAFVTVATAALLLAQVPPVEGDRPVVAPTQRLLEPVMLTTGMALIVTTEVAADTQPVAVLVNMNVVVPADTPVTTPAFVTEATPALVLTQVPPVVGDRVVVDPTQMLFGPVTLTTGMALTITDPVGTETHPVAVLVKVNVAVPADTPVTTPLFVTVATAALLLAQVPPVEGDNPVVKPTQMLFGPLMPTVGNALTVTADVGAEAPPVIELVKVKVTVPADMPVTTPAFVTVATVGSLLVQVPPVVGDKAEVEPTQMVLDPVMLTTGGALTVTGAVGED